MSKELPCSVAKDMMPLLADGLLSPESEEMLREHLKECAACRKEFGEMTCPEPGQETDRVEVDYLKKVRRGRVKIAVGAVVAVVLIAAALIVWFTAQASKTRVSYDEGSKTLVVYAAGDAKDLKLPSKADEAQTLDAQYDSFRMSIYLPLLRTDGVALSEYVPAYLDRTNESLRFLRNYLRENCSDSYPAERADKYAELNIQPDGSYSWSEKEDRIVLNIGDFYWHREELYILSLIGMKGVQWKHLGYAWYLGSCVDPYGEVLFSNSGGVAEDAPYYEAYLRLGGTAERTPENFRKLNDAVSYKCLSGKMYWGTAYESTPLRYTALYRAPASAHDPGNEMSVCMATSFIAYLSDEYGFDRVSAFCFGQIGFEEAFGTDFGGAYAAWSEHIVSAVDGAVLNGTEYSTGN